MKHFHLPFERNKSFSYSSSAISNLTEFEKYQLSFHPERPKYLDYLAVFTETSACLESSEHGANLIQTHRATLQTPDGPVKLMLIGQQSSPTSDFERLQELMRDNGTAAAWNQGMPTPASYERALKAIALAEEEQRIIVTIIDTPGADPTEDAEAGGIAWKIGRCMQALAETPVPTISVIINRGCSGGAIALTGCDTVLAMEYATYLVISPEACSSILFRTRDKANLAAEISQITAKKALHHGIIDELIPEPEGPAHRFPDEALASFRKALAKHARQLLTHPQEDIFRKRVERWERVGQWDTITEEEIGRFELNVSRTIPPPREGLFIKRHKNCRDKEGQRVYDPVLYSKLIEDNYVCSQCGYRYTRLSAHDYIHLVLDSGSFREHEHTRHLVDRDILQFPEYPEKLQEARQKTGLAAACITGNGTINGMPVVFCATDFAFLGGSFCMSTGEKIWRAAQTALDRKCPMVLQAAGGGARMHEGCSSMVSIPKIHVALSRVEQAGLPVISIITDPTLGGVAIGIGSRGTRLFEHNAGNIGFSGKRVIEQYTGKATSSDFQTTNWLRQKGFARHIVHPLDLRESIAKIIALPSPHQ
ncbi:MAG TPA: acetyl-CoA carboxylase carboxyl transferase subunit alpha/beta [Prosthecochloris aestuarii]|uniref:Acetyl-coenzyme A carboxylase carboxyl transferase subunits beta/alpha n=1 Tax=Prosthecochloris aestuarii TaxID=1102 RepID=A0A831WP14_PROAE|nr:acetyl-CoA carboxylase carboxyl transferase subunit alpha/beta [Prosthecochloris aestuarii]